MSRLLSPSLHYGGEAAIYQMTASFVINLSFHLIPLTIGMAILRYRLWDIDIIIRRALVYSVLTAALALIYFSSVVLLQSLLTAVGGQRSSSLFPPYSSLPYSTLCAVAPRI
jgi:hypothetical protein